MFWYISILCLYNCLQRFSLERLLFTNDSVIPCYGNYIAFLDISYHIPGY